MATISAGDAEVALRTFPRRWHSLLDGFDPDDRDAVAILGHPGADGRSAVDLAVEAVARLQAALDSLRSATGSGAAARDAPVGGASLDTALRGIDRLAPALAEAVRDLGPRDLDAEAGAGGTVRSLVSEAVAEVAELLRAAGEAIRAGRAAAR